MGFFDDFFGGMFDMNGDGKTDWAEEAMGIMIMDEYFKQEEKNDTDDDDF